MGRFREWLERRVIAMVPAARWERMYQMAMRAANLRADRVATYHVRPKFARDVGLWSDPVIEPPRFAVVVQGPIFAAEDFTLETLRIYAKLMPGCRLILSTWDDTVPKLLDPIRAAGVEVVLSAKPPAPGTMNVNFQLTSAAAGMRAAQAAGAEWVLKTRTDQRMHAPNLPEFLISVARAFPVVPGYRQKHRIVGLGRGTFKYLPYCVTDQTVFGHIDDMTAFWSAPPRLDSHPPGYRDVFGDICQHHAPESYIVANYLRRIGREVRWTVEESWAALADHFCLVDPGTSDLYWPKYIGWKLYEPNYTHIVSTQEIDFREWLILYARRTNKAHTAMLDAVLELGLRQPVPEPLPLPASGRGPGG